MAQLQVNILSPAKVVARTQASQVQVPGALGYLGILPGHTRFVSELGMGEMTVYGEQGEEVFFVSGGYIDVANDVVTVLVDVIERPGEIDRARAEKARSRAAQRLESKAAGIDVARAMASVARANQRLATAGRV